MLCAASTFTGGMCGKRKSMGEPPHNNATQYTRTAGQVNRKKKKSKIKYTNNALIFLKRQWHLYVNGVQKENKNKLI